MGFFKSQEQLKAEHDANQANWHAAHGRFGGDDGPPPVPGADAQVRDERTLTPEQYAKYADRKLFSNVKVEGRGKNQRFVVKFKNPRKIPKDLV